MNIYNNHHLQQLAAVMVVQQLPPFAGRHCVTTSLNCQSQYVSSTTDALAAGSGTADPLGT